MSLLKITTRECFEQARKKSVHKLHLEINPVTRSLLISAILKLCFNLLFC